MMAATPATMSALGVSRDRRTRASLLGSDSTGCGDGAAEGPVDGPAGIVAVISSPRCRRASRGRALGDLGVEVVPLLGVVEKLLLGHGHELEPVEGLRRLRRRTDAVRRGDELLAGTELVVDEQRRRAGVLRVAHEPDAIGPDDHRLARDALRGLPGDVCALGCRVV